MYNRLMIYISEGSLKKVRDGLFDHMETLAIPYFDTHTHGDLMSIYTNDTDTLRQMISQSIPQLLSSAITIVSVFASMIYLSPILTLMIIAMVFVMTNVIKKIGGQSGRYFMAQQQDLGKVNGFIEEMMDGQKVVKVFCHEEEAKAKFKELNDKLFRQRQQRERLCQRADANNGKYWKYQLCADHHCRISCLPSAGSAA